MNFGWLTDRYTAANKGGIPAGLYSPTRTRPTVETEDRKRISGIVSAQWQPTPELQTTLDVIATRLDVAYDEFGLDIYPDDGGTAGGPRRRSSRAIPSSAIRSPRRRSTMSASWARANTASTATTC